VAIEVKNDIVGNHRPGSGPPTLGFELTTARLLRSLIKLFLIPLPWPQCRTAIACISKCPPFSRLPAPINSRAGRSFEKYVL
jgi:hypothetical protein